MPTAQLVRALPQPAILTDRYGVVRVWNDAATKLFGWTADEMIGRPVVERLPGSARPEALARLQRLVSGGEWDGPVEDYRKDGSRVWVEAHVRPLRDASGEVTGVLDLSEPITNDEAAEVGQRRYTQNILDSMAAHVAVLDREGRVRDVNRAWREFACDNTPGGAPPSATGLGVDYVGMCRACTGPWSDAAVAAADGIEGVLQGTRPSFLMEYPCDSPTEARWFAMHVTPLAGPDAGAVVAHYDITARKLAELTVAAQSRRIELALTAAHMGVWRLELPSGRLEWTPEMFQVVGVAAFEGTLEAWTRLVHPEDREPNAARLERALARRLPFTSEFRVVLPGGEVRWLATVAQVEFAPSGEAVAVVGTAQDITARKRSEWALTTYNHILELIAVGTDLRRILEQVVRLVEGQLPGSLCSVLIVDPTARRLRFGAGGSLPEEYNRAVDGVLIGPKAGSCGTAAFRKAPVTVVDIAADPLWEDYRDLALRHGLRSCLSVPIFSSGNLPKHEKGSVIGTFALYGRSAGEFDRLTYAILSGAEQLVRQAVQAGDRPGRAKDEGTARHSEGSTRVIEAVHLAGVAIERDQASQAVRESEARFRAVLDSSPSAVYLKGLDGRHLFANRAAAALFGVPQAAWAGKVAGELLPAAVAGPLERSERSALAASRPVEERQTYRLCGGREVTALATHLRLQGPDGAPYATCGILNDITDLVGAQRELERLWQLASDPLCVAGFDGYMKQLTPAWTRHLGWTAEELLARPYVEFLHPDDRAGLPEIERRLLAGETVRGYENRYRCRDGSYRWFSWNAIPSVETRTIYGFARDVTEQKRLADQVRQSQRMEAVGQLASGVAHDFNNLLTVINGYAEVLLGRLQAAASERDPLQEILKAGQRAADLTSQLLAFSRKAIVEPKVVDVNQVVDSSARMLRRLIGENVQLETRLSVVPRVKIDPGQLEQVFMNLAVNARDAMPAGGRLIVATEAVDLPAANGLGELPTGRYVRVTVSDTGTGMPPEVKARIFEPFFTTKGPGKGTGLGLATVYGIVRQAGGHIEVESEPGSGATFVVLLPALADAPSDPAGAPAINVAPRGSETVLLVEDEEGVREIASTILRMQGYEVLTASTGADALRLVTEQQGRIDLLLTDVVMPDVSGRAMADTIRSRFPAIRILYMSGYTDDAVLRHGVESSERSFIQKPFTRLSLARRVREVLDAPPERSGPDARRRAGR